MKPNRSFNEKKSTPFNVYTYTLERFEPKLCPNGISTDPANPVNPDPNGRINTFDYTATGWQRLQVGQIISEIFHPRVGQMIPGILPFRVGQTIPGTPQIDHFISRQSDHQKLTHKL